MQATLGYEKSSCADFQDKAKVVQVFNKLNIIIYWIISFFKTFLAAKAQLN